jgi:hypothetical protein
MAAQVVLFVSVKKKNGNFVGVLTGGSLGFLAVYI